MRPRLPEQGYLAVLAKHSAGRRPVVSRARVWRNGLLYSAQTWPQMTPFGGSPSPAGLCIDRIELAVPRRRGRLLR